MNSPTSGHPTSEAGRSGAQLRRLLALRAALTAFVAALSGEQPRVEIRHLLGLWRLCQERLDLLLEGMPPDDPYQARLRLLAREVEGHLLDERPSAAALRDAADGLEHQCELLLLSVGEALAGDSGERGGPP